MLTATQCRQTLAPVLTAMGYEYVGCEHFTNAGLKGLRIYIDCEGGVTCDDCAKVSEQATAALTVAQQLADDCALEVSSPGLDRPLFSVTDFQRFTGQKVKVRLRQAVDGQRKWLATISQANDDGHIELTSTTHNSTIKVHFDNIEKARLEPEF